jgi:ferritin-like metal-binding protein YciE
MGSGKHGEWARQQKRSFGMKVEQMEDLLLHELEDLYDAEQQLVEALSKMEKAAHSSQLQQAFRKHGKETQRQVKQLEKAFKALEQEPKSHVCKAMKGLIAEGNEVAKMTGEPDLIDAALIGAGKKVEHYEIVSYNSAISHAEVLGMERVAEILRGVLAEEVETDSKLSELAADNLEAAQV